MTGLRAGISAALLAGGLLSMTACAAQAPTSPPPPEPSADCGAGQLDAYLGQPASEEVLALIRQWRGDNPIRVLRPGSAMTMDYRPGRLNVFLDENDRIKEFKCN